MEFKTMFREGKPPLIVAGIGKMFYEQGFPLHISFDILKERGFEISLLHVADELYKHGWKDKSIINAIASDFPESRDLIKQFCAVGRSTGEVKSITDLPPGREYIYSEGGYEEQREMIFKYLFSDVDAAKSWFINEVILVQ